MSRYFRGAAGPGSRKSIACLATKTDDQQEQLERFIRNSPWEDDLVLESAISVCDDDSGELEVGFDPNRNPEIADIVAFVWEYVEHTYSETDNLYSVMDDALEERSTDDE